ncbi:MAG: MotA/TolQ/ExbB proton channel family protein, partial [Acidobacteriota bacterium]
AVLVVLAARFVCNLLPDRHLRAIDHFGDEEATATPWTRSDGQAQELLALYKEAAERHDRATGWFGCRVQSSFLELRRYAVAAVLVAENISQVPAFLETKANSLIDRQHASMALTRYLIWAIPTLGFVGTVVGIGESLELTRDLQGLEPIRVAIAKSAVSTSIGVAFDTTFVALVLSLPAMLCFHLVQGLEEMNVLSRKDEAIDDLTHLENAKPFRCHAVRVADGLERLGLTAEVLERRLQQLPEAAALAPASAEPPSPRRRQGAVAWWWAALIAAILGAALAWNLGWIPAM